MGVEPEVQDYFALAGVSRGDARGDGGLGFAAAAKSVRAAIARFSAYCGVSSIRLWIRRMRGEV